MDAFTYTLKQIFEHDKRYVVPMFQRPYVWGREAQWLPLWEDVRDLAERLAVPATEVRPHFLGAIVLDHLRQPLARVEARLIVDGQQRLTTLQLLLEAASDLCRSRGWGNYQRAFVKLTRNEDPLANDPDEVYKVWPTNTDQDVFRRVMDAESPGALQAVIGGNRRFEQSAIAQAYLFFSAELSRWLPEGDETSPVRIGLMHTALRDRVRLVVIDLAETDDAQMIFETLNARGTPLLPADLIKNYLFHLARAQGQSAEKLYAMYWKPFDEEAEYWRTEVAAGRIKRSRIDLFFQHYLSMKTLEEVLVTHLYAIFQGYVSRSGLSVERLLESIAHYARVFRTLDDYGEATRIGAFFRRLEDLEITTAHPLLMHLVGLNLPGQELEAAVVDVESFLVRRLVCHLTTKNYNRLFLDALKALQNAESDVPGALRRYLLQGTGDSVRWPSDAEFRQAWLNMPLYRVLARRRTRMLLESLELESRDEKTEIVGLQRKLTIEHLLPQKWQQHWPLTGGADPAQQAHDRERLLHSIGNLTLLTAASNPFASNDPWASKREKIRRSSVLELNKRVWELPTWDEDGILARGEELFAHARRLWPCTAERSEGAPSFAELGDALLSSADQREAAEEGRAGPKCPIPGCPYVFKASIQGWDGHAKKRKGHHSRWHPEVADAAKRRGLFRAEFPHFFPEDAASAEVGVGREYWEKRADSRALVVADELGVLLEEAGATPRWSYAQSYIALGGGGGRYFAWLKPQRSSPYCAMKIRTERGQRASQVERLTRAGIRVVVNEKGPFRVEVTADALHGHRGLLRDLFESAIRFARQ